jgi:hypothetical protein
MKSNDVPIWGSEENLFRKFQIQLNAEKTEDALSTLRHLVNIAPDNLFYKKDWQEHTNIWAKK